MSAPVIAFFSPRGGVGTTTLVYHLASMYPNMGVGALVADLDPQCSLTSAVLDYERLEEFWAGTERGTVFGAIERSAAAEQDVPVAAPVFADEAAGYMILAGDVRLSGLEEKLAAAWAPCRAGDQQALRLTSALWRIVQFAAKQTDAHLVLLDLAPNLGAVNRAALLCADHVVIPLSPDPLSLHGLRTLGHAMHEWRHQWRERLAANGGAGLQVPLGAIQPLGYVVMRRSLRLDAPPDARQRWLARIPDEYRRGVLAEPRAKEVTLANDPHRIGVLEDYRSLLPMAQEARKPIFFLSPADGAMGAYGEAVRSAYRDFERLACEIARRAGVALP